MLCYENKWPHKLLYCFSHIYRKLDQQEHVRDLKLNYNYTKEKQYMKMKIKNIKKKDRIFAPNRKKRLETTLPLV